VARWPTPQPRWPNTAATQANTTAQIANNAAKAGAVTAGDAAAASAGRLAGALSLLKGLSLAFLVTNLDDIGKWMGGRQGHGLRQGDRRAERQMRPPRRPPRTWPPPMPSWPSKKQLAADAALGLSERPRSWWPTSAMTKAGETTAAALEKIGKDLDLSNIKGIADAGAALDALAQRGKISADQVQDAWEGALKDVDLQAFEVNARAAFDSSEQGARRLAAALEAQLGEALRRTGKDWGALAGGINDAAQKAINASTCSRSGWMRSARKVWTPASPYPPALTRPARPPPPSRPPGRCWSAGSSSARPAL
jgi:hypothetical protein